MAQGIQMPPDSEQTTTETAVEASTVGQRTACRPGFGWRVLVAVGAGGALGSWARYEIALALPTTHRAFPWATWCVNVTGSFALGLLIMMVVQRWPPTRYVRPFAAIGVCGGYTTWSTFMVETALLVRDDRPGLAVVYLAASLAAGLAATYTGMALGRGWPGPSRRSP
jgi:fluoride exporter